MQMRSTDVTPETALRPAVAAALTLPPDIATVHQARAFVRDFCRSAGVAEDECDTTVLLASEVVTNAFVHGRSDARVVVSVSVGSVRVEVGDDNARQPHPAGEQDGALDGRGLRILAGLASGWGVREEAFGKTVWFEVQRLPFDVPDSESPVGVA
jgi:anti-sigma regulatory factor (Ser/Thr protein kinase)